MKTRIFVFILSAWLMLGIAPTFAQDLSTNTPEGTLVATEPAATVEPTAAPTQPPVDQQPDSGFDLREFLLGALVGGTSVLIAVFGVIGRVKNDVAALNAIEWLGKSIPVEALDKLNELGRTLRDAGEVLDKVTDGQPN